MKIKTKMENYNQNLIIDAYKQVWIKIENENMQTQLLIL